MKMLLTGSSGQLCKAFIRTCELQGLPYSAPPQSDLDITNPQQVAKCLDASNPDILVNTAAYNHVDRAETCAEKARAVNAYAVAAMAEETRKRGIRFVHFSSDYVFDGTARRPYQETDIPNPINVYGQSKRKGEQAALSHAPETLILRISWVYGNGSQNFFHKLDKWSAQRDQIDVVWDQISTPTYTEDVVDLTLVALKQGLTGIWHAPNGGYASRYEVARAYLARRKPATIVLPINTDAFPSPAQRPFFSALSNQALSQTLDFDIPSWQDALSRYCDDQEKQ